MLLVSTAIPNAQVCINHLLGEGDEAAQVFSMNRNHTGPFIGQPPTGRVIFFTGIHYYPIKDERIRTTRYEHDLFGLMEQLGMLPSGSRADI